tara:strand:- start:872 stop:997 length:126 start_codon:yes stop_codon:yes gene_type:complete
LQTFSPGGPALPGHFIAAAGRWQHVHRLAGAVKQLFDFAAE